MVMMLFNPVRVLPTYSDVVVAEVPVALVNVSVVKKPLVDERSVEVAAVLRSDWMVEEARVMSEFGMVTRPFCAMAKKLVVAEPFALVEEATSKRLLRTPKLPWMDSLAKGVEVPMEIKEFWLKVSVEVGVRMVPAEL